jgi:hypothetical protein
MIAHSNTAARRERRHCQVARPLISIDDRFAVGGKTAS